MHTWHIVTLRRKLYPYRNSQSMLWKASSRGGEGYLKKWQVMRIQLPRHSRLVVKKNGRGRKPLQSLIMRSFQMLRFPSDLSRNTLDVAKSVAKTQLTIFAEHAPPMVPTAEIPFLYVLLASMEDIAMPSTFTTSSPEEHRAKLDMSGIPDKPFWVWHFSVAWKVKTVWPWPCA